MLLCDRMSRADTITRMTLRNMRENGVRSLLVYCRACSRTVVFNVDHCAEAVPVPAPQSNRESLPWGRLTTRSDAK